MWERGLKQITTKLNPETFVAPYVGAWIETREWTQVNGVNGVAPYVGAWIETPHRRRHARWLWVAPYVGAWIETSMLLLTFVKVMTSLPMWERGLKHYVTLFNPGRICRSLCGSVD